MIGQTDPNRIPLPTAEKLDLAFEKPFVGTKNLL
jgi:hypothetical protein